MIGKLVLSSRNTYIKNVDNKSRTCKKCYIISDNTDSKLIYTDKEFNTSDLYVIIDEKTDKIKNVIGTVGNLKDDLNLYHYLFIKNWMSNTIYKKLWNNYLINNNFTFDIINNRSIYDQQVITIDPINSIDLDDGFKLEFNNDLYLLDIHIADPISYFNMNDDNMKNIIKELLTRINTCYIPDINNNIIHLLPLNVIKKISFLQENNLDYKRSLCFSFIINKITKDVDFTIKHVLVTNIYNTNYDDYDNYLNNNIDYKNDIIEFINILIDIMNLNYLKLNNNLTFNISHTMIEIFMIFVNFYSGKYFQSNLSNMIVRIQDKSNNIYKINETDEFNLNNIPSYVHSFLNYSANYKFTNSYDNNYHHSLNIHNYCHVSSPMRRVVDMINHMIIYNLNLDYIIKYINIDYINNELKRQKKIINSFELINQLHINNKFTGCILDFNIHDNITYLLLVITNDNYSFKKIINVEIPIISNIELRKYNQFDLQIYYNPSNFKSSKFPFSIKIL